ncbi:MAG: CcmD family protein [Polyangiaceae bacterium]
MIALDIAAPNEAPKPPPTAAPAPPAPNAAAATTSSPAYRPVTESTEQHDGFTLMVEAYALVWLFVFVWVAGMWRSVGRINTRIDDLEKAIDVADAKAARATPGATAG